MNFLGKRRNLGEHLRNSDKFLGNMLYDMQNDKKQNVDISKLPENKELVKKYSIKLEEMRNYVNKDPFLNQ